MISTQTLQRQFLTMLPRIKRQGQIQFRSIPCDATRRECIAETLALTWKWFCRLIERGRDPMRFSSALAAWAARAVRNGRRLNGQEKINDAMSPFAQAKRRFKVQSLPLICGPEIAEALHDNHRTPPDEQAAFRLDWPNWLATRNTRDRQIMVALMVGDRPRDVANRFGLSPGRISQLRRDYYRDWMQFRGETVEH